MQDASRRPRAPGRWPRRWSACWRPRRRCRSCRRAAPCAGPPRLMIRLSARRSNRASSGGFAAAIECWGRLRRGPPRPPPILSRAILPSDDTQPREAAAARREGMLRQSPELRRPARGRADGVGGLRLAPRRHRARAHRPRDPGDDVRDDHPLSVRTLRPRPRPQRGERQARAGCRGLGRARAERPHARGLAARRDGERSALPPRRGESRARRRQDRRVSAPRLGIVLSAFTPLPTAEFLAVAREAEARGYHTAWTGEVSGYDAISVMTLIASHTERIHVGSAVLPVQTRTPVGLGMSAASLNHFAPGRVGLGLGLSSKTIVADWHGPAFSPSPQQIPGAGPTL